MMIPQVAARILDEFGQNASLVFDPFCGTGTSLVEASLRGLRAIGTDINPLARLIAKVKTTPLDLQRLDEALQAFQASLLAARFGTRRVSPNIPRLKNLDYWFKRETQHRLGVIKELVDGIADPDIRDFFKVAFSETVREVSLTRNGEFKLYRMMEAQIRKFHPDVEATILSKLARNRRGMEEYLQARPRDASVHVLDFNTVQGIPASVLPRQSVDLVLTSPPYGDSRTTVAYGQFSRLSMQWLGLGEHGDIDRLCMGGGRRKIAAFGCKPLDEVLERLAEIDEKRASEVAAFYADYARSIEHVAEVVKPRGIVAYVVGNRRVKGMEIPNDEITKSLFEQHGFVHLRTIIRAIPNKRMPRKNSPTNIRGQKEATMNYEYIVVLAKAAC